jgi:hypothetical protein
MWSVLAAVFALSHLALIVLLIVGAPLALRWSWMPKVHTWIVPTVIGYSLLWRKHESAAGTAVARTQFLP